MNRRRILEAASAVTLCAALAERPAAKRMMQGRVLDTRGLSTSGCRGGPGRGAGGECIAHASKRDGTYLLTNLQTGTDYEVRASYEGLASAARPFRISNPGERVSLDLAVGAQIRFEEVAAQSGIDFVQRNGATGHHYQPEIMIAGVAAFDFDGDGCTDLFFANGANLPQMKKTGPESWNRLYAINATAHFGTSPKWRV
jgi:hypothetical protein